MYPNREHHQSYNNTVTRSPINGLGGKVRGQGRVQGGIGGSSSNQQLLVATSQTSHAQPQNQQLLRAQQEYKAMLTEQMIQKHQARSKQLEAIRNARLRELGALQDAFNKSKEACSGLNHRVLLAKNAYETAPKGTPARESLKLKYQKEKDTQDRLKIVVAGAGTVLQIAQREYLTMDEQHKTEASRMWTEMNNMTSGADDLQTILRTAPSYP